MSHTPAVSVDAVAPLKTSLAANIFSMARTVAVFAAIATGMLGTRHHRALAQSPSKPNIVLIYTDDSSYGDYGFMDQVTGLHTQFKTPNLDRLASQSVLATNAYGTSSLCSMSRAGLMTGLHPERYGYSYNADPSDAPNEGFPSKQVLMSERLKQEGYKTAAVGKWHLGVQPKWQPQNMGFDDFYGFWEHSGQYYQTPLTTIRRGTTPIDWWAEPSFNNVPNDPYDGRYLTDAFGDEASKYIAQNAGGNQPFFLYVPFTGPHAPYQAKLQDLAQFEDTTLTGARKTVAAMQYAVDRNVGNILARIDDPNLDGNREDSIANNTIVVFLNDNGGPTYLNPNGYDNAPLAGFKGSGWEGGLRTPLLVRAPGVPAGTITQSVSAMDLFPTFVAAAGGQMTTRTDGVNLLPYLKGAQTGPVHDALFFRDFVIYSAVREGDWKLAKPFATETWKLFHLNPDGSGETVDLAAQNPQRVAQMVRDFVAWEVTVDKPRNSTFPRVNNFDVFVRRNDLYRDANWRWPDSWRNGDNPSQTCDLHKEDPSPNTVLVFTPNNDADYWSANTRNRMSGVSFENLDLGVQDLPGTGEFMLNEIRFQGEFAGAVDHRATIEGKPVLFVKNLAGKLPGLRLDGTVNRSDRKFLFALNLDAILYHDLVIDGNGDATFEIGGVMRNFWDPAGVTKRGASTIIMKGHNTYTGATVIEQGHVVVAGDLAALDGTASIETKAGGRLTFQSGLIRTDELDVRHGSFNFLGGVLQTKRIRGDLANNADGVLMIGGNLPTVALQGSYVQTVGTLRANVDGHPPASSATLLAITGQANLSGNLELSLSDLHAFPIGQTLRLLQADGGRIGQFSSVVFSAAPGGFNWSLIYDDFGVSLKRLYPASVNPNSFADFDADGDIDGADFLLWQANYGASGPVGNANGDELVDAADLDIWTQFEGSTPVSTHSGSNVPEPEMLTLLGFAGLANALGNLYRHSDPSKSE